MTHAERKGSESGFSESEAQAIEKSFAADSQERRGHFRPRIVLVQLLSKFGAPDRAVLVGEREQEFVLALPRALPNGERVLIFDNSAPDGPRDISGIVISSRRGSRQDDKRLKLVINYVQEDISCEDAGAN